MSLQFLFVRFFFAFSLMYAPRHIDRYGDTSD